eukprot:2463713-Ditylum_brightwellii.AAC.1
MANNNHLLLLHVTCRLNATAADSTKHTKEEATKAAEKEDGNISSHDLKDTDTPKETKGINFSMENNTGTMLSMLSVDQKDSKSLNKAGSNYSASLGAKSNFFGANTLGVMLSSLDEEDKIKEQYKLIGEQLQEK